MKKLSLASIIAGALLFSACNGNSNTSTNSDSTNTTTSSSAMNDSSRMNNASGDTSNRMNNSMAGTNDTGKNTMTNAMVDNDTKDFAKDAAEGGMMEVQLGNIAQKNSATQAVKDFGKMMVDDHTKINDNLKSLASRKNVDLPTTVTTKQQKDIDDLSKKTGADFDKAYVSMMIDDHKKDISDFKKAGDKIKDPDFKTFVMNSLPTLQKHLDAIENIKKKM